MCLLIALFGVVADAPLIVAANRDERYTRPSVTITTLRDSEPRILGGRDELAGGTWLAVNEHGVVAGLTNQPSPAGPDASKRSRGELPLALAACRTAEEAAWSVAAALDPADYNPCWLLVGDRDSLLSVGLAGGGLADIERLAPGLHVLENVPFRARSAKAEQVTRMVIGERARRADDQLGQLGERGARRSVARNVAAATDALAAVLSDHRVAPPLPSPAHVPSPAEPPSLLRQPGLPRPQPGLAPSAQPGAGPGAYRPAVPRPPELSAACVHTPEYGTRSAIIVTVPAAAGPPALRVADGPPCQVPFQDVTGRWDASPPQ